MKNLFINAYNYYNIQSENCLLLKIKKILNKLLNKHYD